MPTAKLHEIDPLADLRARFIDRSRERVATLRALIDAGAESRPAAADAPHDCPPAEAIARLAHQLAGAAGTFGYAALSEAAAALEDHARAALHRIATVDPSPLAPLVATVEARLAELAP